MTPRHRRPPSMAFAVFLGLSALVLCTGADGDYVVMTLEQPSSSPFSTVVYEIAARGETHTAMHRRELPGYGESLHGMGLLTRAEAQDYWRDITALGVMTLPDHLAPKGASAAIEGLVWQIQVSLGGVERTFRVADAVNVPDRRYHRLLRRTRDLVHQHAGELPFRNVFIPPDRLGWINVLTVPVAKLYVGDFDTELETPIYGYEVPAGTHTLRLKTADGAHERTYDVRIEPGGTTLLRVDLR